MDAKNIQRSNQKSSKTRKNGTKNKHLYMNWNRLKGVRMVKPFVYGNLSWKLLPEQQRDCHTHQWIVYVRGYNDEDISAFVKFVQFKLHVSYDNPVRVCTNPPYQVTETGWGEFEVVIRIHFKDQVEKPVTLYHYLKLLHKEDPTLTMYQLLNLEESTVPGPTKCWIDHEEKKVKDLEKILVSKKKLRDEISDLKTRLADAKAIIGILKSQTVM